MFGSFLRLKCTFPLGIRTLTNMRVVGLISGGKDSCFNLMKCVAEGHDVVALANLHPASPTAGELDSYMYQTAGHEAIETVAQALDLPLHRRALQGTSLNVDESYAGPHKDDEVEDLYELLREVKETHKVEGVSVGAVLSDYQRVRVEDVCSRLGLTSLAYLWCNDQKELLQEMLNCQMEAVMVKVACMGLEPEKHLNRPLSQLVDHLTELNKEYGVHVCGEGGEYETLTLDSPLHNSRIIIEESEVVHHTKSSIAPVGYLKIGKLRLEPKAPEFTRTSWAERVKKLPMHTSERFTAAFLAKTPSADVVPFVKKEYCNAVSSWPEECSAIAVNAGQEMFCSLQAPNTGNVAADAKALMDELAHPHGLLKPHFLDFSNLVYVLLYIKDMSLFGEINAVYKQSFGVNPPPRICVEAVLPNDSLFHAQVLISRDPKQTRHVQGVSHWAPSCIGPYSQACKLRSNVFVSGQIPLVPGSMKPLPTGFPGQCQLALDHVKSVANSMGVSMEHTISAHCYVHREEDVSYCLGESIAGPQIPAQVKPLCMVVPRLPRDVLVEWHCNFNTEGKLTHSVCSGGDDLDKLCEQVGEVLKKEPVAYFLFYSAPTIDVSHLLAGMKKVSPNAQLFPIPVVKVVSDASQLTAKYQLACVQIPGYAE